MLKNPPFLSVRSLLHITAVQTESLGEAQFKEFKPRLKFEKRLKHGWFHLKLYSMFQDLSRRTVETGFWRI